MENEAKGSISEKTCDGFDQMSEEDPPSHEQSKQSQAASTEEQKPVVPKRTFKFVPRQVSRFRARPTKQTPSTQQSSNIFTPIPDVVLRNIFGFCSHSDLQSLCQVCQRFRDTLWDMATDVCSLYSLKVISSFPTR